MKKADLKGHSVGRVYAAVAIFVHAVGGLGRGALLAPLAYAWAEVELTFWDEAAGAPLAAAALCIRQGADELATARSDRPPPPVIPSIGRRRAKRRSTEPAS
jgi:hypothetical protein